MNDEPQRSARDLNDIEKYISWGFNHPTPLPWGDYTVSKVPWPGEVLDMPSEFNGETVEEVGKAWAEKGYRLDNGMLIKDDL